MVGAAAEEAGFVSVWQPWSNSKAVKLQRCARTSLLCRAAGAEEGLDLLGGAGGGEEGALAHAAAGVGEEFALGVDLEALRDDVELEAGHEGDVVAREVAARGVVRHAGDQAAVEAHGDIGT